MLIHCRQTAFLPTGLWKQPTFGKCQQSSPHPSLCLSSEIRRKLCFFVESSETLRGIPHDLKSKKFIMHITNKSCLDVLSE